MRRWLALGMTLLCGACGPNYVRQEPPWPLPTPVAAETPEAARQPTSLWSDAAQLGRAFDDHRARRVGDLVTVLVVESSEAQREESTGVSRDTSVDAEITNFLGSDLTTAGMEPRVGASTGNSYQGSGSTKHKEVLRTRVTARVVQALPDGNLVLEGRRQVGVHNDTQYLYVRGIARTEDISAQNTISSTALADAQIVYGGQGLLARQQKPGWMYGILDAVWPF